MSTKPHNLHLHPNPANPDNGSNNITTTSKFKLTIAIGIAIIMAAAFAMPNFISRLFRPLSSSARLGMTSSEGTNGITPTTIPEGAEKATIAAGCFWGVEHLYRKHFGSKGLIDARVGYTGGDASHPNYRQVCSQSTGHAEALQILFDPTQTSYRQLLEFFYRMHDPTTANRQGPDVGTQYRSAVYFHGAEQERVAREVTGQANAQWYGGRIATEVVPAGPWWDAEEYHQLYLDRNPSGYECPSHFLRTFAPLK